MNDSRDFAYLSLPHDVISIVKRATIISSSLYTLLPTKYPNTQTKGLSMIDSSDVGGGGPLQYSSSSEGPELRDLVDSHLPPLTPDDDASGQTPPSPRSTFRSSTSLVSSGNDTHSGRSHRRSHRRSREGHRDSGGNREMVKTFVSEQYQDAKTKRYIRIALERLDSETKRAQEAERRALELAERFRVVNDARLQAQTDLTRANEELRLWKMQYETAQSELRRGQDMLRDVESQRDQAESSAAQARSVARKLREKHLVLLAREEGRKQGYEEGLKQAREELRAAGYRPSQSRSRGPVMEDVIDEAEEDNLQDAPDSLMEPVDDREDVDTLDELNLHDLPVPQAPSSRGRNAPGSRFREHGISPATTTASLYPQATMPVAVPMAPPQQVVEEGPPTVHPIPIHNAPAPPGHPQTSNPPDGWIPRADETGYVAMPPPHELDRPPPSPRSPSQALPIREPQPHSIRVGFAQTNEPTIRDYGHNKGRSSPRSLADSIPSTTISQFDLVNSSNYNSPKNNSRSLSREQDRGPERPIRERKLSTIHETSFSDSNSPGLDSHRMPEAVVFPSASPAGASSWGTVTQPEGSYGRSTPRSRQANQRLADELRYGSPEAVDEWRRSTSEELQSQSSRQSLRRPRDVQPVMPSPLSQDITPSRRHTPSAMSRPRSRSPAGPRAMSPGNLTVPPERSRSLRTVSDRGSDRGNHTGTSDSGDISIRIEPPSGPGSSFSPVQGEHSDLLSPNAAHAPLPQAPPEPEVPTVPNSPATRQRYPSVGILPNEAGAPPLGFMPTGPAVPYSLVPGGPSVLPPPLAQSSPKQPAQNIYGWNSDPRAAPIQRSSSATPTPGYGQSKGRHSRTQSTGQYGMSTDSLQRPGTAGPSVRPPSVRPPSAGPQQRTRTPQPAYETAPTPPNVKYPLPPPRPDPANMSPQSVSSRISGGGGGHHRSLSLNAGSTPATATRPLSAHPPAKLRRVPSAESINSATSKGEYTHYQPNDYVDPAFLASSDDLANMQSPTTAANTRANAFGAALGNSVGRSSSPAASFSTSSLPRSRKVSGPSSRLR